MIRTTRRIGAISVVSIYFLLSPFGYLGFALAACVPSRDPERRARRVRGIMTSAFRFMHWTLRVFRIIDFDPRQNVGRIPPGPCVLVPNHPTLTDISALIATEPDLLFPVKPEMFHSFWGHSMFLQAGLIEGAGQDPFSAGRMVDEAVERVARGSRIVIFPEGTRSPERGLHPFGRAAFEIAVRADVPVVPIVITCEPRWMTRSRPFFSTTTRLPRLRLRVLDPIHPGTAGSSSRTLRDIVCERIRAELDRADIHSRDAGEEAVGRPVARVGGAHPAGERGAGGNPPVEGATELR